MRVVCVSLLEFACNVLVPDWNLCMSAFVIVGFVRVLCCSVFCSFNVVFYLL